MANRFFNQFLFSFNKMLTYVEGNFVVGATGAVGTLKGSGIKSVVRLYTGTYQINLEDSYPRYLAGMTGFIAPVTGASVSMGSLVTNTTYIITALGNSTTAQWVAAGVQTGVTPAVGVSFVAIAAGAGTGTVKAAGNSGIAAVEVVGNPNLMITNNTHPCLVMQCLDYAGAVADPVVGSVFAFSMFLRNSSVVGKGE
jgi:hypothetical protein